MPRRRMAVSSRTSIVTPGTPAKAARALSTKAWGYIRLAGRLETSRAHWTASTNAWPRPRKIASAPDAPAPV